FLEPLSTSRHVWQSDRQDSDRAIPTALARSRPERSFERHRSVAGRNVDWPSETTTDRPTDAIRGLPPAAQPPGASCRRRPKTWPLPSAPARGAAPPRPLLTSWSAARTVRVPAFAPPDGRVRRRRVPGGNTLPIRLRSTVLHSPIRPGHPD